LIGVMKGHVVHRSKFFSGLETLVIGAMAAALAYGVGAWLGDIAR
jgi:VIT1/CCC1 family predicted Fe2+/Mn2+ transporter